MLDHICEDIQRLRGLQFSDAGLFEYTHTRFKKAYKGTSRRTESAMEETIAILTEISAVRSDKRDIAFWQGASPLAVGKGMPRGASGRD